MAKLRDLRCYACGAARVMAVAPGTGPAAAPYTLERDEPVRAWCCVCWARVFGGPGAGAAK